MKATLFILVLSFAGITLALGQTLRISELGSQADEDTEPMTLRSGTHEEHLFVKKAAVLTEKDVKEAGVIFSAEPDHQIHVRLNDEGTRKFEPVTERLSKKGDRLAIIVDGRLISAPAVMVPLNREFSISGLFDLNFSQLDALARKMSGRPPAPPEDPNAPPPLAPPQVKRVPYTEEEFQANKAAREKLGIFHLDKIPSEDELNAALRKGMPLAEVIQLFGHPSEGPRKSGQNATGLTYEIAPEKRPGTMKVPSGFTVLLQDANVVRWGFNYSSQPREEKVIGEEPSLLVMILPQFGASVEDADFVKFFENIKVPNPRQKVNKTDFYALLGMVMQIAAVISPDGTDTAKKKTLVNANCDIMLTLAHHFPEIATLRQTAQNGVIPLDQLEAAVSPYVTGQKPLPVELPKPTPNSEKPAATPAK